MYRLIAKVYPEGIKQKYGELMRYSGIGIDREKFLGFIIFLSLLIALFVGFYSAIIFDFVFLGLKFISVILLSFIIPQLLIYFWLLLKSDSKAKFVEGILPDVLQLMSSNLRAGLTTDKALLLSARPEFGSFKDEINKIGKEITTGKDIGEALSDMGKRINSDRLKKTVTLIVSGLKSGGELSSLLDQSAKNLRQEMLVDAKIRSNVMMYVIFIFIAVCVGAPLLFSLGSFLVEVLAVNLQGIEIPKAAASQFPIDFSGISIDTGFVVNFAILFLVTSSIFGGLIIGSISKGKEREGLKYIPILLLISLTIFFLIRLVITNVFGNLFGF